MEKGKRRRTLDDPCFLTPDPAPGTRQYGSLRRLTPISDRWGLDRGTPVDRHYIEHFLGQRAGDIRGRVLEIGDYAYTRRFGGAGGRVDVLDVDAGNPDATIVGDLSRPESFPRRPSTARSSRRRCT